MPLRPHFATTACLLASACAPSHFGWHDDGHDVAAYRAAFGAAAGERFVATATDAEIVAMTRSARVLWLGDHHRSQALHRHHFALLELLARSGRPLTLVLEAIAEQDDALVRDHLAGGIDGAALRSAVRRRWPGSWLDDTDLDFAFYRQLLAFAGRHGCPVHGLEPAPRRPLSARDGPIAARVRALAAAHPERLVVVVVGQAHLLGAGDLIGRCGLPSLALGGEPTAALRRAPPPAAARSPFWRSDSGLWWFADLVTASAAAVEASSPAATAAP